MTTTPQVGVLRVYEQPTSQDGCRVLVDRVWPRGLRKTEVRIDDWCKQIAPSTELRKWYGHDPARFAEFRRRYLVELEDTAHAEALAQLRHLATRGPLTLLTATKQVEISQATVLADAIRAGSRD